MVFERQENFKANRSKATNTDVAPNDPAYVKVRHGFWRVISTLIAETDVFIVDQQRRYDLPSQPTGL